MALHTVVLPDEAHDILVRQLRLDLYEAIEMAVDDPNEPGLAARVTWLTWLLATVEAS